MSKSFAAIRALALLAPQPTLTLPTKYYSYTTTVTLAPIVLRSVLCTSSNANHARSR